MNKTELLIIGAGPAGYQAALHAARLGHQVVLAEKDQIGGTCLNRGCVPTKSLLEQAHQWAVSRQKVDVQAMRQREQQTVQKLREGIAQLLQSSRVQLIPEQVSIADAHHVCSTQGCWQADHILIATGSAVALPPIEGIEQALTSDDVLRMEQPLPQSVILIGAGVIGMELADLYLDLGVQVTMLEAADRCLSMADRQISQSLQMIFKRRGATMIFNARVMRIENHRVEYEVGGQTAVIQAEAVVVATGRRPVLPECEVRLKTDQGRLVISETMQTSVPSIYAAGDAASTIQLAHYASAQAIAAVDHMFGVKNQTDLKTVPSCVYTHPQAAWVGLQQQQAHELGIPLLTGKASTLSNARAQIDQAPRGFVRLLADGRNRQLIGGMIVGDHASEWISTISLAIAQHLTVDQCRAVIFPHPSWSETLQEALLDFDGLAIHTISTRR